ncbi:hypothetical protein WMY93_000195 [Mugilogobius chulae]|uniref:Transposase Helix-turn-helix domain-containing protein n=1 Tax=Mugilogobius chulae TaxID=88201 RepID=A0AAW0Q1F0_9GOBI
MFQLQGKRQSKEAPSQSDDGSQSRSTKDDGTEPGADLCPEMPSDDIKDPDFVPFLRHRSGKKKSERCKKQKRRKEAPRRSQSTSTSSQQRIVEQRLMLIFALSACGLIRLKQENEQYKDLLRASHFSFSALQSTAAQVAFSTGLSGAVFTWLLDVLRDGVRVVCGSLTLEDHLLLILTKLRSGLTHTDLVFRFTVAEHDVANVLRSWLPVMSQV